MLSGGRPWLLNFNPDSITDNPFVLPIVIRGVRKGSQPIQLETVVSGNKHLDLSHEDPDFTFEFAALNCTRAEKNQFAYKLEGCDHRWVYCRRRHNAQFINVPPGEYAFRLKGSNNEGEWNEEGTALPVSATPPFWGTWWLLRYGG